MAGRKAPRPLPRPVRWLAMFLALVFVVSLGMVVNHESSKATGGASDASSSTPAKSRKEEDRQNRRLRRTEGRRHPHAGDWSRQRVLSIVKEQQGDERKVSMKPVGGKGGPVDVALDTVDRILDPTPSDEEWNDTMQQLFQPDIAGQSHGPSNMARYWDWYLDYPRNFNESIIEKYLGRDYRIAGGAKYTILEDNIGYIYYGDFSSGIGNGNLDEILLYLSACNGLIIDVRNNGGGNLTNATRMAQRFTNEKVLTGYIQHKTGKGHSDFSDPTPIYVEPSNSIRWQKNGNCPDQPSFL